jgi:hypothetical protein
MTDKVEPKDLEKVLAQLTTEWQALANLLAGLGKSPDRVVEVEKLLLRDAAGHQRGRLSAEPEGTAELFLCDPSGNFWVRLGVNQAGEACLELKDKNGAHTFTVEFGALIAAAAAQPREASVAAPPPVAPAAAVPPAPGPPRAEPSGREADAAILARQAKLERQNRRQKLYWALILVVLGVVLATQAYLLFRPYPPGLAVEALVVRDANGRLRASLSSAEDKVKLDLWDLQGKRRATLGLGAEGAPGLAFYDRYHRLRAELSLGPDGEPQFTLCDKHNLQGKTEAHVVGDSGQWQLRQGGVSGNEEGTVASSLTPPAPGGPPAVQVEPKTVFYGFKRSNKYHYPWCKYLKGAKPEWLIKFNSVKDAQAHHYIPCPVCKPPPLSR